MSQVITRQTESNKQLCEAYDCELEATEEISVNAGEYGPITLLVCANCRSKFVEDQTT